MCRLIAMRRLPLCLTILIIFIIITFEPKLFYQDLHCALYIIYIYNRDLSKRLSTSFNILMNSIVSMWCTQPQAKMIIFNIFRNCFHLQKFFFLKMNCRVFIFLYGLIKIGNLTPLEKS